ncbi:MAG TPA: HAD family hydrolase [Desulfomonilia bacterium]
MLKTGVFLDRDDTIIKDVPYLKDPDMIMLLPGASRAVRLLNDNAIFAIIITNQSGIARGLLNEADLEAVHKRLRKMLADDSARIDAIYSCPHHPDGVIERYAVRCRCRKPETGLLEDAARDFSLNLSRCYFIGDKQSDIEAIHRVGGKGILVGHSTETISAEYHAKDILDAAEWVIRDICDGNP